jgi:hypothetical protein
LELVDVEEGGFLKQGDAKTTFARTGNRPDGQVAVSIMRDAPKGATGEGPVAVLAFRPRTVGETSIRIGQATALPADTGARVTTTLPAALKVRVN